MTVSIGKRLIELLETNSMKQKEAADRLDIKVPTFNGYVNNIREPNIETLIKIADFFNVTVDYLIGRDSIDNDKYNDTLSSCTNMEHLDKDLLIFVGDPENILFINMAKEIKDKLLFEGYQKI